MRLEQTHDMQLVRDIMVHPAIWKHVHDDGVEEPLSLDCDGLYWMLVIEDETIRGLFMVHHLNSICCQMHTCLLPEIWGEKANEAAQMLLKWAFTETVCEKMTTLVPSYNRLALRFAKKNGMQEEGSNRASFKKNGQLFDQIMLGITKQEWKLCQSQYP